MNGIQNDPKEFLEKVNALSPTLEITGYYTTLSITYLHCRCKKCGKEWDNLSKTLLKPQYCRTCKTKERNEKILNISDEKFRNKVNNNYPNLTISGTYKNGQYEITCICNKCGYKNRIRTLSLLNSFYKCSICKRDAERKYNIKKGYLSGWLKGKSTLPVGNYTWKYVGEKSLLLNYSSLFM